MGTDGVERLWRGFHIRSNVFGRMIRFAAFPFVSRGLVAKWPTTSSRAEQGFSIWDTVCSARLTMCLDRRPFSLGRSRDLCLTVLNAGCESKTVFDETDGSVFPQPRVLHGISGLN